MPQIWCCFPIRMHTPKTQRKTVCTCIHTGKHGRMGLLTASLSLSSSLQLPPTPEVQSQSTAPNPARAHFFQASDGNNHPHATNPARISHERQHNQDSQSKHETIQDSESGNCDDMNQADGPTSQRSEANLGIAVAAVMQENGRENALACLSLILRYLRKVVESDDPK
jgi:hypothetical protein